MVYGFDPGHGGRNTGARAVLPDGRTVLEKDIVWRIAMVAKQRLPGLYLTRYGDDSASFRQRSQRMHICGAEVVVSGHCDSTPWAPDAHGLQAYHRKGDRIGKALAEFAAESAPEALRTNLQGVICAHDNPETDRDNWKRRAERIVTAFAAPTVLLEFGRLSNAGDLALLTSPQGIQYCADLVCSVFAKGRSE